MHLPTKHDFILYPDDLDQIHSFKNFGGLSLREACLKFIDNPHCYQEDFMFMGIKAFAYYYPAIFDYLSTAVPEDIHDNCCSIIIADGLVYQHPEIIRHNLTEIIPGIHDNIVEFISRLRGWPLRKPELNNCIEKWEFVEKLYRS